MVAYLSWQYCAERLISRGASRRGHTLVLNGTEGANFLDSSGPKINPLVKLVGATSGPMILAIAGWAVYLGLNSVQL
jgi:hypothetical protein